MNQSSVEGDRRLLEYFAVVGLSPEAEELTPSAQECGCKVTEPLAPITDICVIFPGLGETVPDGFECIDTTPLGHPADLNHGSLRTPSVFLCFRRGYHKPPIVDIGVLDESRGEKPMVDSNTVTTTPFGRSANVNNASQVIFLNFRRAPPNSPPNQLVVTHICVILANKGETAPHTYYKISKNLNKGMVGSDVYLCYKKSQGSSKRIAYKPAILDSFPKDVDFPLAVNVSMFCLPMGAVIECWPEKCQPPDRNFSTFVLTDESSTKYYGASVSFYEKYKGKLTDEQLDKLELGGDIRGQGAVDDSTPTNDPADEMTFHVNKSICIISRYPFFSAFKRFLFHVYRMSLSGSYSIPVERYISHLMYEVPFPIARRPRVLMQLGNETVCFESHDDSQLPLSGAAFFDTLKVMGPENLMYLMLLALLEQKILVHSLRSWLLTAVSESICALMFPFHWQCPYIPQCPLALAGVLHAPTPFIAGVDSRYFDLYEDPPSDVTCFDLDTQTISHSTARQWIKLSLLPKKATKQLRTTLESLYRKLHQEEFNVIALKKNQDFTPVDVDQQIQKKRRNIEIGVQDAFLRFVGSLMDGYTNHLRPIMSAPKDVKATDTVALFDLDSFLKSRDKSASEFFKKFSETQCFIRFIEERSFVSDRNAYNAFFDDCIQKIASGDDKGEISFLDQDNYQNANHTVFVAPPEPLLDADGNEQKFQYDHFPSTFNPDLFGIDKLNLDIKGHITGNVPIERGGRCAAIRTKQEVRSSFLTAANNCKSAPLGFAKVLLFYAYSLWFLQLPSLLKLVHNKVKILRLAFHILNRMEESGILILDQVCYRILIQMCGDYGHPMLAVRVLQAMQRAGLEQNALTYGIYHRAVMHANWPTGSHYKAIIAWDKLRVAVFAVARFKKILRIVQQSRPESERPPSAASARSEEVRADQHISNSIEESQDIDGTDDKASASEPATETISTLSPKFEISSADDVSIETPQKYDEDPLGALSTSNEGSLNDLKKSSTAGMTMSPSRQKFLEEHANSKPFSKDMEDINKKMETLNKKSSSGFGSSWLKGLTKSPIVTKLMRSQTFGDMSNPEETTEKPADSAMSFSPSFTFLVSQMRKQALKGYDNAMQDGGNISRLKQGVSLIVNEVKNLNKSYGRDSILDDEVYLMAAEVEHSDPAYQLSSGNSYSILKSDWWIADQLETVDTIDELLGEIGDKGKSENDSEVIVDAALSSCSQCPNCKSCVFDEDLMAGWTVDDSNLNSQCPYCTHSFVPTLTITVRKSKTTVSSWYVPRISEEMAHRLETSNRESKDLDDEPRIISVPFISPLVLRREVETLLSSDITVLHQPILRHSHPIVFWNLLYYSQRTDVPTHLSSWIAPNVHVRCTYDVQRNHDKAAMPLYLCHKSPALRWLFGILLFLSELYLILPRMGTFTQRTQELFAPLITKPPLTDQLLQRPPFKFIADIVAATVQNTEYLRELYGNDQLDSSKITDKTAKINFLQNLIDVLNDDGSLDEVKPSKIVAGKEPELTNLMLQKLASEAMRHVQAAKSQQKASSSKASSSHLNSDAPSKPPTSKSKSKTADSKPKIKKKEKEKDKEKSKEDGDSSKKKDKDKQNGHSSISSKSKSRTSTRTSTVRRSSVNTDSSEKKPRSKSKSKVKVEVEKPPLTPPMEEDTLMMNDNHHEVNGVVLTDVAAETVAEGPPEPEEELPLPPPSFGRPVTSSGRPQTSMGRPGTAVARPAPPKLQKKQIAVVERPQETVTAESSEVIIEERVDDPEEEFLIVSEPEVEVPQIVATDLEGEDHGNLVKKMLESKMEIESSDVTRTEVYDESSQQKVRREINNLQGEIQQITQTVHPLARLFDFVQEDFEGMVKEVEEWRKEGKKNANLLREQSGYANEKQYARAMQLKQLDQEIKDIRAEIARDTTSDASSGGERDRPNVLYKHIVDSIQQNNLFRPMQCLINEHREAQQNVVHLRRHFSIFRDIQFVALSRFGNIVDRDQLDHRYQQEFERLPPRITPLLPIEDYPPKHLSRACRKVFLPLDLE
uniref:TRAF3-interacting protein 1 n=1 Tax=Steinernema glaseri TaxID=37863 RepID=A0A1I8AET8_9BILA